MSRFRNTLCALLVVGAPTVLSQRSAHAGPTVGVELIANGGFEAGTFSGWTVSQQNSGAVYDPSDPNTPPTSGVYIQNYGGMTPVSGLSAIDPASGSYYAISDSTAPSVNVLIQSFTVSSTAVSVGLSFDLYAYDWSGFGPLGTGLDFSGGPTTDPNQRVQVDLLTASAGPFDAGAGSVLGNFYDGVDPEAANGLAPFFRHYDFDLTSLALPGGTYQLRFAQVDNQFTLNMGVDGVSVTEQVAVPEPSTWMLTLTGGVLVAMGRRLRHLRRVEDGSAWGGFRPDVSPHCGVRSADPARHIKEFKQ